MMDKGGKLARAGQADAKAVQAVLLRHPYFGRAAPKSTGRDEFPFSLLQARTRAKGADLVATATALTVRSIALAYENAILRKKLPLDTIYFCGGGAKNPALWKACEQLLPAIRVEFPLRGGGLRSPSWSRLKRLPTMGAARLLGLPLGGAWTGARGFGPPAHLIPGVNWRAVASRLRESRSRPKKAP